MTFELRGYSERGMIWTLFGELAHRGDANKLLAEILKRAVLRGGERPGFGVPDSSTVLIEQSFSGFGDADVLLLLNEGGRRRCVIIEAKVSCRRHTWDLTQELPITRNLAVRVTPFSKLYCQLYAKQCLVEALAQLQGAPMPSQGVLFLEDLGLKERKLGSHELVLSAVELLRPYIGDATYLALVPSIDGFDRTVDAFEATAKLPQGKCKQWGALAWERIEELCRDTTPQLKKTLQAFQYNGAQIYGEPKRAARSSRRSRR